MAGDGGAGGGGENSLRLAEETADLLNGSTPVAVHPNDKEHDESDDVVEQRLADAAVIKAPDGGYGWVIVAASFFANMCVDGIIFTVGATLLPLWQTHFNASVTEVSLTISLLSGSYLLIGPVASAFANTYGCRLVACAGAALAFFAFIFSTVMPNVAALYVCFGVIGGIGLGLVYLPSLVIVSHWFSEKRALATGLAVCGSGIGTTVFSTLNAVVISLFDSNYRLFLVYVAGVALLCILSGIAFKSLKMEQQQVQEVAEIVADYQQHRNTEEIDGSVAVLPSETLLPPQSSFNLKRPFLSTLELHSKKIHEKSMWSQRNLVEAVARDAMGELNRPLSRADIFYPGSTATLAQRARAGTTASSRIRHDTTPQAGAGADFIGSSIMLSRMALPAADEPLDDEGGWKTNLIRTLTSMIDTELLSRPSFIVVAASSFLTLCCFYVPYIYLGNHLDKIEGITAGQKQLPVSLLGIINIAARIGCGYIADRPSVDALLVSNVALIAAGIATAAVPFFGAFWHFVAYCIPFACGVACFAALRTVICVELFGLEKLSSAFGMMLLFMGVGAIVGSPLAALIKDLSGNFDLSFYVMGTLMALSGIICLPLRRIRDWEDEREMAEAKKAELFELERTA